MELSAVKRVRNPIRERGNIVNFRDGDGRRDAMSEIANITNAAMSVGIEQERALMRECAVSLGIYYHTLVTNGVPVDLAAMLTSNWHNWYVPRVFSALPAPTLADGTKNV